MHTGGAHVVSTPEPVDWDEAFIELVRTHQSERSSDGDDEDEEAS